ncbi:hypothetical protein [Halobiforma nitratireducens]|uniref:hypothetical protein n=1 Tax=Halobiforma nitratireducens TaxID=130048 RepID=UPI00135F152D|nr:hypothetical protein [Halobiforma nitratireducens]
MSILQAMSDRDRRYPAPGIKCEDGGVYLEQQTFERTDRTVLIDEREEGDS